MSNTDRKTSRTVALRRLDIRRPVLTITVVALVGFVLGAVAGPRLLRAVTAGEAAAVPNPPPFPMAWRMGSNLYVQTAAEYRACCLQIYKSAGRRLDEILGGLKTGSRKPAVVMDLDETVLDNSAFQTFLYNTGQEYSDSLWLNYERHFHNDVTLVPGAKDFIDKAESKGVTIVYISNRSEANRQSTIKALQRLGMKTGGIDERMLLKRPGKSSDKSARRAIVAERYDVLLHIGDNLRDFSETFAAGRLDPNDDTACATAIDRRQARVDSTLAHWATDWFILPNPVYGEWERPLGARPEARMHPTTMQGAER